MNRIFGVALVAAALVVTSIPQPASAQAGRMHRATRRRTAVVVGTTVNASDQEKAAASQSAAQPPATAQQPATAAAKPPAAAPAAAAGALAVGTVAATLPAGCGTTPVSGVEYYHCGNDWYRSAFQGNTLVYVTTAPPN